MFLWQKLKVLLFKGRKGTGFSDGLIGKLFPVVTFFVIGVLLALVWEYFFCPGLRQVSGCSGVWRRSSVAVLLGGHTNS